MQMGGGCDPNSEKNINSIIKIVQIFADLNNLVRFRKREKIVVKD